ncbi:MAG: ATP-dependent Clp protease proteolytic subunit [Lachnospiraceae bacterium]|nr:ATP-dependent Clp protease proteolytic subunit [Lachnospiraceae bacterium]
MIPNIRCISKTGQETMDLLNFDYLENRTIYIFEEVDDALARDLISQLQYLDTNGRGGDIRMYINSPGGSVTAGLAIADAMNRCKSDIVTVCTGIAASMGAFLLSCGTRGKRYATPLSEIMIHQPLGGVQGQASDIELVAAHIARVKQRLNSILAQNTGQCIEKVSADSDRDYYMSADEALAYGIVDHILTENL